MVARHPHFAAQPSASRTGRERHACRQETPRRARTGRERRAWRQKKEPRRARTGRERRAWRQKKEPRRADPDVAIQTSIRATRAVFEENLAAQIPTLQFKPQFARRKGHSTGHPNQHPVAARNATLHPKAHPNQDSSPRENATLQFKLSNRASRELAALRLRCGYGCGLDDET
jgi:hypothetical protein